MIRPLSALLLGTILSSGSAHAATGPDLPREAADIVVIGASSAGAVPENRVPANVTILNADSIAIPGMANVQDALARRLATIDIVDSLGQSLQSAITLRGFTAAPALGEPQGVAIYQGNMRVNEAFGDVVQWDLLPAFAIDKLQVVPGSNPVYGLNSIGGAVILRMKNGFDNPGGSAEGVFGRFGRRTATIQYGASSGGFGVYGGAQLLRDDGWRRHSPSRIDRGFADLAWREGGSEIGLSLNLARSRLTGNGPAPADLLATDRRAVFTYPDITRSRLTALSMRASHQANEALRLELGGYYRFLKRRTVNGDQAEFEDCADFAGVTVPPSALCFGAEAGDPDADPEILTGTDGQPITGFDDDDANAVFNRTNTRTKGAGASGQLVWNTGGNIFILGGSLDIARTRYESGTELGTLLDDRGVESLGAAIGNDEFNVGLRTYGRFASLYASDTLSLGPRLHITGSAKWTDAILRLRDQRGTSLTGDHHYRRFDPAIGAAFNATRDITLYASYARNGRIPTPAELSCADPDQPCRFPNAFLADPPLKEVRAETLEAGLKGHVRLGGSRIDVNLSAFQTVSRDDIIFISAGPIIGTGYFSNIERTRRQGAELALAGQTERISWSVSYAYVRATYDVPLKIQSPDNPAANADGEILVEKGDRLPGIPLHSLTAALDYAFTDRLKAGVETRISGNRYLRGDESNEQKPISGFATFALHASFRSGPAEFFGRIDNLFNKRHETFGLYGAAGELGFDDPRFLSPGMPRSFAVGVRAMF